MDKWPLFSFSSINIYTISKAPEQNEACKTKYVKKKKPALQGLQKTDIITHFINVSLGVQKDCNGILL